MIDTIAMAKASAIIYSFVETARANNLNPFRYTTSYSWQRFQKHIEDTDWTFLKKLEPWSQDLPTECRKQFNQQLAAASSGRTYTLLAVFFILSPERF